MNVKYIPDKEINLEKNDSLGSEPYVTTLLDIISKTNTPFTIGLFGGWGIGKSSIIKTIQNKLNNDKKSKVAVFTYDAWKYSNDSFRRTFLYELKEFFNLETKDLFDSFYEDRTEDIDHKLALKKFSGWWWLTLSPLLLILIWLFTEVQSNLKIAVTIISVILTIITILLRETFVQYKVTVTKQKIFAPEQFEEVFSEIIGKILNKQRDKWEWIKNVLFLWRAKNETEKLIIVIDNIDRCHRSLAFELLLTIKGFLEQKGVVFIIPIDEGEIKKHLINQGNEPNEFIRKLFNTTISIKGISESDFFDFAKKLNDDYELGFKNEVISIISQQFSKNPRKIIQFLNVLQTEVLLSENQESMGLVPKGSITKNLTFFTKLLIVKEEWPALHQVLKEYPHKLKDIYGSIIDEKGEFKFENYKINNEQRNFLRRTNHIIPNHKNYELFFINKDSFKNVPESTNGLVESNDLEGIKEQLNSTEISFDELIKFIDERFEKALKRNEIKTTVVAIINLLFSLSLDEDLNDKTKSYLVGNGKFLGGFKYFINSNRINEIVKDLDKTLLLNFTQKFNNTFGNLLNNLITHINESENDSVLLMEFVEAFKNKPNLLNRVSVKFSDCLSMNNTFALKAIPFIKDNEDIIPKLIASKLIDEYIEKTENSIESDSSNQKLEIVLLYHKTVGLSKKQLNAIVEKLNSFVSSINDYIKLPYWLKTLKPYLSGIETETALTNIFNTIANKQNWLWQQFGGSWNKEDYQKTLKIYIGFITELYCATSNSNQENQLIAWLNQYFGRNESQDLIKFINNLYYSIIDDHDSYTWPFAQNIITRFNNVNDWETKREIARTLNLMLSKTTENEGLTTEQIQSIYTNYTNQINDENQDEIIEWLSESLENNQQSENLEKVISNQSEERKFELLKLLNTLKKEDLILNIISSILRDVKCNIIQETFDKIQDAEIDKKLINKSIKSVLNEIKREKPNFDCLIKFLSNFSDRDNVVDNLIAEKVKNLLATANNDEILFAVQILENIKITATRKLNAIKAFIQDLDERKFEGKDLKKIKKIKKKYK